MRTNAHLAIRHDVWCFMSPSSPCYVGKDVVNYFWPEQKSAQPFQAEGGDQQRDLAAELAELLPLKNEVAFDNIVSIPRMRHWDINAWYQTPNEDFDGL